MVGSTNQILCITNNRTYKDQFRFMFSSHHTISTLFIHNMPEAVQEIQLKRYCMILIDEDISLTNAIYFEQLLLLITSFCLNPNTIIIVPKLSNDCFCKYIRLGFTYISDIQIAQYMIPAILKYFEEFKTKRPSPQQIYYKGLYVYPKQNMIILKKCKIFIPYTWILILLFMVNHGDYCNISIIHKYVESMQGEKLSNSYISVNIHRLARRITNVTGLKIIRNRYGVGYYLVL